uniref:MOR2-PAG1_N domain-containing protein n=1 Tax=Heterorhabditis bacteriophora TaxID=37862 RepID=A0A1I7XB11_HETBA
MELSINENINPANDNRMLTKKLLAVNYLFCLVLIEVLPQVKIYHMYRQFMGILTELKKDASPTASHNIVALLMAMKFVKIKTNQVDDFEMGIRFLDDLGSNLLEMKDKDVKHAVAGLLVEILLPVAAQIKREANIPALITFVSKLYGPMNELASKKQHKLV